MIFIRLGEINAASWIINPLKDLETLEIGIIIEEYEKLRKQSVDQLSMALISVMLVKDGFLWYSDESR